MTTENIDTDTTFGRTRVRVLRCDSCEKRIAQADSWAVLPEWHHLTRRKEVDSSHPTRTPEKEELDFCSKDCLITAIAPELFEMLPAKVESAVSELKQMESVLSGQATPNVPSDSKTWYGDA